MKNEPLSIFNFSSLTDIVMLLLIFFLISSQFVVNTGVKLKLPGAKNNEQLAPGKIVVSITDDNKIFVGKEEVTWTSLAGKIEDLVKTTQNQTVIIRADKTSPLESTVKVMDISKGVGIDKFTISTEKISF